MLAKKTFPTEYLAATRTRVDNWLETYDAAPEAFVLALDRLFVHRQRGLEDKKDSSLKALRDLCEQIEAGNATTPDADGFRALADGVLDELQRNFT